MIPEVQKQSDPDPEKGIKHPGYGELNTVTLLGQERCEMELKKKLPVYPDYHHCLVNLANSIRKGS